MIKPFPLHQGDNIGLIAPGETIPRKTGENGITALRTWGYQPVRGKYLYAKYGFLAGRDDQRVADIHQFVKEASIKGIFAMAGGSNCNRLLPLLDWQLIKKYPKIFYGMSDVSTLLNAIHAKTGLITFHGLSVLHLKHKDAVTKAFLQKAVSSNLVGKIHWHDTKVIKEGTCRGKLIGGNLESVANLLGTPYCPSWKKSLFFLEELKETNAEISRILMNYKNAGVFDKIKGMVVGKLYNCNVREKMSMQRILLDLTKEYDFPIIMNAPFGHFCENITIPIGVKSILDTEQKKWEIVEAGCE